jgi:hypothetical protein
MGDDLGSNAVARDRDLRRSGETEAGSLAPVSLPNLAARQEGTAKDEPQMALPE